jgi:hypothetical protein
MKRISSGLPLLVLVLAIVMAIAGVTMHGFGQAGFERGWNNLLARPGQSLALRFLFQPVISMIMAIRDGMKDARNGRSPYLWAIVSDSAVRWTNLREGIAATGKIFLIAIILDVVYQRVEFDEFYPGEALLIAILLAFIPYLITRGLATRFASVWRRYKGAKPLV